jgi:dipeptide transport system substrate-binding protein
MRTSIILSVVFGFALSSGTVAAKTLVFCSEGSPESISPQLTTTTTGMNATRPVFNNLVEFAPGTTRIEPALAESWTVSEDGREYTFHLRHGVKFHSNADFAPTREMNANDVLFSLMRQWKDDHPYSNADFVYFNDMGMKDLLEAIDKVDDYTVRIRLTRPNAPFLADMAMDFNAILSAEYADRLLQAGTPEKLDTQPIGTGPFTFVSFQKDVALRYRAFDGYWGGRQPIDTLVFSITPNPAVRLTKLKAGECHVMAFPNPGDAARIAEAPELTLMAQEGLNIGYMSMNTTLPPFDDARVRRAINMAIDKAAIVEAVYGKAGVPAKNPIPPTLWSYNTAIDDYHYDPAAAQKLLVEAGHPNGFQTELWYMPVSRPYMPEGKRVAEMIQADLSRIGVRLRLMTDEWSAYRQTLQAGRAPMALFGWTSDNGDPDNFLHVLLGCPAARQGGSNVAKWCDPAYDALVTEAKMALDRTTRVALYGKAQEIFKHQAPWMPIAHSVVMMGMRKTVIGFKLDPVGRHLFTGVDLAE